MTMLPSPGKLNSILLYSANMALSDGFNVLSICILIGIHCFQVNLTSDPAVCACVSLVSECVCVCVCVCACVSECGGT